MAQKQWKSTNKWMVGWALAAGLVFLFIPLKAAAQCGDDPGSSSCIDCHETQKQHPVSGTGIWHDIHALKDSCWNCHGGNTETADKELAHEGMLENPLEDVYTDCFSCHPADYLARAGRFAAILGMSPGSCPTPTPVLIASVSNHPVMIAPAPAQPSGSEPPWLIVLFGVILLGGCSLGLVLLTTISRPAENKD